MIWACHYIFQVTWTFRNLEWISKNYSVRRFEENPFWFWFWSNFGVFIIIFATDLGCVICIAKLRRKNSNKKLQKSKLINPNQNFKNKKKCIYCPFMELKSSIIQWKIKYICGENVQEAQWFYRDDSISFSSRSR